MAMIRSRVSSNERNTTMEVGLFAIGIGRAADPDLIAQIARKADDIGFASLWAPETRKR
jgi:hypothetical protein